MRAVARASVALAGWLCGVVSLQAADAPAIVIPGKPGVPVIINGYDASYTVVEGDWGLDRPGHVPATIVSGPLVLPEPFYPGGYFPAFGRRPGYGRYEIEPPPNRRLPPPAESYRRFWGAQSDPLPATIDPPAAHSESAVEPEAGTGNDPRERWRNDAREDWRKDQREARRKDQHDVKRNKESHQVKRKPRQVYQR